jgi:hypothetical protein
MSQSPNLTEEPAEIAGDEVASLTVNAQPLSSSAAVTTAWDEEQWATGILHGPER